MAPSITPWVAERETRAVRFLLDHGELAPELWTEVLQALDSVSERACAGRLHIMAGENGRIVEADSEVVTAIGATHNQPIAAETEVGTVQARGVGSADARPCVDGRARGLGRDA